MDSLEFVSGEILQRMKKDSMFNLMYFSAMKLHVHLSILLVTLPSYAWVDCAKVSSCASMRSWFPGTPPSNFLENLPYQLSVHGHTKYGYFPGSSHTSK